MNLKMIKVDYNNMRHEAADVLVNAVHELLREITGKELNDRLRDQLHMLLEDF